MLVATLTAEIDAGFRQHYIATPAINAYLTGPARDPHMPEVRAG
jgi:hypothetical protein